MGSYSKRSVSRLPVHGVRWVYNSSHLFLWEWWEEGDQRRLKSVPSKYGSHATRNRVLLSYVYRSLLFSLAPPLMSNGSFLSRATVLQFFPPELQCGCKQERAMWMQAIREAISLGQELLSSGEAGRESVSSAYLRHWNGKRALTSWVLDQWLILTLLETFSSLCRI